FSKIAISKLFLMIKWYSKVSIADLSLLSSTAILSNIGQILIVKELIESDSTPLFKELSELFDFRYTEYLLLNTTTSYVSAQIIRYLNLSADLIEIIEYSDNPKDASPELQKLCVANHIVNSLIDLEGNIAQEVPKDILDLMDKFGLQHITLIKALQNINNNKIL
ncbi:MAG: hypothetical protein U9P38_01300, partial [Campylobacterota bacterium]|nr:hypothetical protein [Campylobacterota bacterium]